jgi:hypothetical protein
MDGSKEDLDVCQTYIFPEQCQMLLNKIDSQFFSQQWKDRSSLVNQYGRLIKRLNVVDTLSDKTNPSSGLLKALLELEYTSKVTMNSQVLLRAIAGQARSRQNRLLLGKDMFGRSQAWVPRLSYDFYADSVEGQLEVLKFLEGLEEGYRTAFRKEADLSAHLHQGIECMQNTEEEATKKIGFLTGPNGELSKIANRITEQTVELKEKQEKVKVEVSLVTFSHRLNPNFLIDGFSTLTSLGQGLKSLEKLVKLGKDIYKYSQADTVMNDEGKDFKDEYVIRQLAECTGRLESLETVLKTKSNNEISMDDPTALKVMAKMDDIEKLMQSFKDSIADGQRSKVNVALDEYKKIILLRNDTVMDYNSSIQLLMEARHEEKYAKDQATSLRDKQLALVPTIPAVSFWLRRTRDNLKLQLMQRLDYASRAVRYWGLEKPFTHSEPGPLPSFIKLQQYWLDLGGKFRSILERYAGNVRSTWPDKGQKGLFYDLTGAQLASLTTAQQDTQRDKKVYKVSITLEPKVMPFGAGRADVRLNEVRLWLVGAKVNPDSQERQRITTHIQHMGDDVFEDENDDRFAFSHDMMSIPFEYDSAKVKDKYDLTSRAKLNKACAMQGDWPGSQSRRENGTNFIAAVGPFATWLLIVREWENPGLDMRNVVSAHLEFHGANRSFK